MLFKVLSRIHRGTLIHCLGNFPACEKHFSKMFFFFFMFFPAQPSVAHVSQQNTLYWGSCSKCLCVSVCLGLDGSWKITLQNFQNVSLLILNVYCAIVFVVGFLFGEKRREHTPHMPGFAWYHNRTLKRTFSEIKCVYINRHKSIILLNLGGKKIEKGSE